MANPAALPAPGPLRTPEQLVRRMAELRQWAGQPSLRTLRRLAGTTTTTSGTVIDALPSSTTSYLLNGRGLPRPPRLELVDAFVTACLLAVDHPVHQISPVVQEWRSTWRAVSVTDVDRPPSPSSRPDHEPSPSPGLDQSAVAGDRPALPRRSFIRSRTVLAAVGAFALGATAAVVVLDWGRAGSTASTPTAARQTSMVREVRRGTVSALGDKQGIDLDLGVVGDQAAAGIDISPYALGNYVNTKSGALLALLDAPGAETYPECASLPAAARKMVVGGLHAVAADRRLCVWTREGRVAMVILDQAPSQRSAGLAFHYVVWQPGS